MAEEEIKGEIERADLLEENVQLAIANIENTLGAFHLVKISGISGSAVNGTRFVGSSYWKIPRKSGKSKKVVPLSRLEFPNGMSCSIYASRSLYQFEVHRRAPGHVPGLRPNGTTFYQSEIPLLLPPKFPVFFRKWKAPLVAEGRVFKYQSERVGKHVSK